MIDIESKIISCREDTNDYRLCLTREEIEEIKEALSKQIPLKKIDDIRSPYCQCPVCGNYVRDTFGNINVYCGVCGQKLSR